MSNVLGSLAKESTRVAVVSDIHGNSAALSVVIAEIRRQEVQAVIVLGDLLTYGCDPNGVVGQLLSLTRDYEVIFIKGNHDQFYFDLDAEVSPFIYKVPEFVKESVLWTHQVCRYKLGDVFQWQDKYALEGVFFAHANPFVYGDWRYINSSKDHAEAARALRDDGYYTGVFGHTHRSKIGVCSAVGTEVDVSFSESQSVLRCSSNNDKIYVLNTGSIGQPRGTEPAFLLMDIGSEGAAVEVVNICFDTDAHLSQIECSSLSRQTKDRLKSYFVKGQR